MTQEQPAKRHCTASVRKRLLQATKELCAKKLSELTDDEILSFMKAIGWPKNISSALESFATEGNLLMSILNRMLVQMKRWMTVRPVESSDNADAITLPRATVFRTVEIKFIAYMVAHISDINALHPHSHLLMKMSMFDSNEKKQTTSQQVTDKICIESLQIPSAENVLGTYRESIEAVTYLLSVIHYGNKHDGTVRTSNRLYVTLSINEVAQRLIEDINVYIKWNEVFQALRITQINKPVIIQVIHITISLLEHMTIIAEILKSQLEDATNAKHAYNCAAQMLFTHLMTMQSELEDYRTHSTLVFKRYRLSNKECSLEKVEQRINNAVITLRTLVTFPLTKKYIPGLKQMLESNEYEDLMDMDQLGNMDLDDSSVTYNRRFILNIVQTMHRAESDADMTQCLRGLATEIPDILETIMDALKTNERLESDISHYGALLYGLLAPLIMRMARRLLSTDFTDYQIFHQWAIVAESVDTFCKLLNVTNKRHVLIHSGEKAAMVSNINNQAFAFVIDMLTLCYNKMSKIKRRRVIMEDYENDTSAMRLAIKRAIQENKCLETVTIVHVVPRLWDSMMLLVALSLENADKNIQQILTLLYQDSMLHEPEYHEAIFNMLIKPQVKYPHKASSNAQVFTANLVSMYSGANDINALIDHIGEFVEARGNELKHFAFISHPPAILAFYASSQESTASQIPMVIDRFTEWLKKKNALKYMEYPLMAYLRGIELSATLVNKVDHALVQIMDLVKMETTPQGVLMAIQLLITIRKIFAWSNDDNIHTRWKVHVETIVNCAKRLCDTVENDCSTAIWTALFWFAYHFKLISRDNPNDYAQMEPVIESILAKLNAVANANLADNEFIDTVCALAISNAHVFEDSTAYVAIIKSIYPSLITEDISATLLNRLVGTIDILAKDRNLFEQVLSPELLNKLLMNCINMDMKSQLNAISIVKLALEYVTALFSHQDMQHIMQSIVNLAEMNATQDGIKENTNLSIAILQLMNFILRREDQLGVTHCINTIITDCQNVFKESEYSSKFIAMLSAVLLSVDVSESCDLPLTLEVIKEMAKICDFILTKLLSAQECTTEANKQNIAKFIKTIGSSGDLEIQLAILLAEIIKNMREEKQELKEQILDAVKLKGHVTEAISEMVDTISETKTPDNANVIYITSVIYCAATRVNKESEPLKDVAKVNEYLPCTMELPSEILSRVYEALLEVVYQFVLHANEDDILKNTIDALFVLIELQQCLCVKRQGLQGFPGEHLETFKSLCGCDIGKMSQIVEIILDIAEPMELWENIVKRLEYLYDSAEKQPETYKWMSRAAVLEVVMLFVDRNNLKTIYGLKKKERKNVLNELNMFIVMHLQHMEVLANDHKKCENAEVAYWLVINLLTNIAVSIKIVSFTRFQVNKTMHNMYCKMVEHLINLGNLGIRIMAYFKRESFNQPAFKQVASCVYISVYSCIRIGEGMGDAQIAKLVRPWMKRIHMITHTINQFVALLHNHDADMFAYVARWMDVMAHTQLVDATQWYIPHILCLITQTWYKVNKAMANEQEHQLDVIRSNKLLKSCVTESIGACEHHAAKTLFLILPPDIRAFIKENSRIFNRTES
ncbi:hypothetical protein BBOV_III009830 [Babesia bovis T2Bo]|uniref:Uncharacterized protein n=1 Tax=Babesia bovis TaxID=5865 RepID=A7APQ5_BABBO|nr:hypothetical protein BBOV_III009830 [Babesia bovis T2Bo]EDO08539.1 hypothetical protein BBOV_III009830 [Babesia bovis T2Bo]|eukprot:XP_001612107.1 hypothetical protein [Babesia bovis T2Bo]